MQWVIQVFVDNAILTVPTRSKAILAHIEAATPYATDGAASHGFTSGSMVSEYLRIIELAGFLDFGQGGSSFGSRGDFGYVWEELDGFDGLRVAKEVVIVLRGGLEAGKMVVIIKIEI
jgi:hypothetical protein